MSRERILITVKTYPTLSRKYGELVCTAGVREDGSWIRLYPIPFRLLDYRDRYAKFDWIETTLVKSTSDPRPETFYPVDARDIVNLGNIGLDDQWRERRRIVLEKCQVQTRLADIIAAAHENRYSLTVFKPAKILDLIWEEDERDWNPEKLQQMRNAADQGELFAGDDWRRTFDVIPKLPYKFSYRFADAAGRESELQVLDWEIGQLYWNCLKQCNGNESLALAKVSLKYRDAFRNTDLHFFLGTTKEYHSWALNPWVIIGVFHIPHRHQLDLL